MKVSIIVPVYNIEGYIGECLESLVRQTFQDIEIIVVDDGSTDGSTAICRDYAEKYPFVDYYRKDNGGLVSAWKFGLTKIKGEYVAFVDGDDFVTPFYVERLLQGITDENIDMVCTDFIRYISKDDYGYDQANFIPAGIYSVDDELLSRVINDKGSYKKMIANCRWAKLFKADLAKRAAAFCREEISYGEDQQFTLGYLFNAKKIHVLAAAEYYYRLNPTSITASYKKDLWAKSKLLIATIANAEGIKRVKNAKTQLNTLTVLYANDVVRNELLHKTKNTKQLLRELFNDPILQEALQDCYTEKLGRYDKLMIKALRAKSYAKAKFYFAVYKIYCRLTKKRI